MLFLFIFFQSRRFVVNVVEYITNREVLSQLHGLHGRIGRSQTWRGQLVLPVSRGVQGDFEVGLQFAHDVGIHEFSLEGDSLVISNALSQQSPPPSSGAQVVYGINVVYKYPSIKKRKKNDVYHILDFLGVEIFYVCRQGNKPAHLLVNMFRVRLVLLFKQQFSVFKHHNTSFYKAF